ncbi:MAG: prolyl oligopeptidase family serine peptidase [Lachnospiraceae bacterium]|nr:prolyl oligopeptidase family serine peptidase [Lachnospiraceae bacterium]
MIREEYYSAQWQFPFVVYRPNECKRNLPLIVQLHGAGEAGNGKEQLHLVDVNGFSKMLVQDGEYPCIFVMPQCSPESFWAAEVPNIYEFIKAVIQKYEVDEDRVYLTGMSMGGYGTWYTALRYPELFAAIAPVCGGGMVWRAGALKMPIWAFHGTEDTTVYPSETMNMIAKIRTVGTNKNEVKMTILDNVGHNAWDYAYTAELLEWLLSHRR